MFSIKSVSKNLTNGRSDFSVNNRGPNPSHAQPLLGLYLWQGIPLANLCITKWRRYLADKSPYSHSYGFFSSHVWMWELDHKEGWAPKNWCFWTVVLEKTLESPWTARRSNQSALKKINPEYSLEGLMLKLQYFGHLMQRADSLEKTLMLGRIEGGGGEGDNRGWDGWMASPTQWTWVWASSRSWWWPGKPGALQFMGLQRVGYDWATELNRSLSLECWGHSLATTAYSELIPMNKPAVFHVRVFRLNLKRITRSSSRASWVLAPCCTVFCLLS